MKLARKVLGLKQRLVAIIHPGEIIDKSVFSSHIPKHLVYAEALVDSQVSFLSLPDCLMWFEKHPSAATRVMESLAREVISLWQELASVYKGTKQRLIELLVSLADETAEEPSSTGLSEMELAEMLGISRETVVRHLSWLRKSGLVTIRNRQVVILDRDGLGSLTKEQNSPSPHRVL